MSRERLPMRKIHDVLRLHAGGLSKRRIAVGLNIGRTAVGDYSAFLTRIWRHSDSLFTINVLVLIWIGFNKTGRLQDALFGFRQTGGVRRLRRR